jgi:hypothetical protein
MMVLFWCFLALALALDLALALVVMAAPAFLDPPPRRRSEGDFMAAPNRWSTATPLPPIYVGIIALQHKYCDAQKSPENATTVAKRIPA